MLGLYVLLNSYVAGSKWQTYDIWSGRMHSKLTGHYDNVNCCAFLPEDQVTLVLAVNFKEIYCRYWAWKSFVYFAWRFMFESLIVQELYTGSSDRQILVWSPPKLVPVEDEVSNHLILCSFFMFYLITKEIG